MNSDLPIDETVTIWIAQLKAGNEDSFERIWFRYFPKLVDLARKNMANRPTKLVDEDDIAQSVLASFYFRAKDGKYPDLNDRDGLWKLLLSIALNKVRADARKEGRRAEILEREFAGESSAQVEPSPELAAEMNDQLNQLFSCLSDELLRQIAIYKLEGRTNQEIATLIGKAVPTVERKLRLIRKEWALEISEAAVSTS